MLSKLKSAWSRLVAPPGDAPSAPAVEYKGYRIQPGPYLSNNVYQTAGAIEKDGPDGVKRHEFIRADTYANRDDAVAFTVLKAKQIIDTQGDRMFR